MMSFNKHKNLFKGISNAVEATSKEEEIHGKFGIALYEILRDEHSELFTPEFFEELKTLSTQAFEAECGILDWILKKAI
ncbi:ribonucleotide reductase [Actinobacillus equuli]|nr:ribonucleotide reductase [Actinobacillus equuli]